MVQSVNKENFVLVCQSKDYNYKDINLFMKAINFVQEKLETKKRLSGNSFFEHNLNVGKILVDNGAAPEIVLAGLLHGLLDNEKEIQDKFGKEIFLLVEGVEEIKQIKHKNKKLEAEALKKIIFTTLKDVRVIILKLANKLDNLRSINALPQDQQKRIAQEVIDIYAPLAYRLGIEKIKVELEDLAFKIINPRKYQEIVNFLVESHEQRERNISTVVDLIKTVISKTKINLIKIKGRPKHIFSIYKKITKRGVNLKKQYDLLGIRIIVKEIKDCYSLLGLLHENFEPLEERLKDYIANPKPNLYRSIHTALKLSNGKVVEIQIRTPEMNEFAEEGVAAHWRYKGLRSEESFEKRVAWLKSILDLQKENESKDFLEATKIDVFGDKIYCYTPKGDLKELPLRATILDFAYTIHEEVGNHAVAGRINGKFSSLRKELNQGDVIEIITNKLQRPRRSWIKVVKSAKAKQKIRKSLKEFEKLPALHFHLLKPKIKEDQGVLVESADFPKAFCVLAKCCDPLPGEEIIGIMTKRKLISTHKNNCKMALREENRWIPVTWKDIFNQKIRFFVRAEERSGVLADLLHTIANAGFEVKEAKAKLIDLDHAECSFLVIPRDLDQLQELVNRVLKVKGVTKIYFE